ncbi:hypothetical protein HYV81_00715 [Candidatus Woesearchaeota archaeon]|nr:hypothetical protein [Candidatus Woesearchaeota archaeon]
MHRHRKAQIAITDLFIAIFIFTGLIIAIFAAWNTYLNRLEERITYSAMLAQAVRISDVLVKSQGRPVNWEANNASAEIIGLASSDRNISVEKVTAFTTMDYNTTKELLNIKGYNYKLLLMNINNSALIDYGNNATGNLTVAIRRIVWYGNGSAYMDLIIWK